MLRGPGALLYGSNAVDGGTDRIGLKSDRYALEGELLLWYARIDNAADKLAYSATSILTRTAPGKSPLPGRSLKLGLRASF